MKTPIRIALMLSVGAAFMAGVHAAQATTPDKTEHGKKLTQSPQTPIERSTARKPSQAEPAPIRVTVSYGDKETVFVVSKLKEGTRVEFSNNQGDADAKVLKNSDYAFLRSKVEKMSGVINRKEFCSRSFIELRFEDRILLGCLGAPNPMARELQDIANLLTLFF